MKIRIMLTAALLCITSCFEDSVVTGKKEIEHDGKTAVERHGKIAVVNNKLSDRNGKPIQLRGVSTHGIQYFDNFFQDDDMFEALGSADGWRADVVRLSLYAREGGYEDRPEYFTRQMDRLVESVTKNGMYAIIDWHQLHPGDPNLDKENAKIFFEYMAQKHGSKDNVIFEICNEPNNTTAFDDDWNYTYLPYNVGWDNKIKPYAEEIIPIIRAHSDNIIIVGTPNWGSEPNAVIGNELDDENVMYSMHFYAGTHGSYVRDNLIAAIDADLPLFITEFGTQNSAGEGDNDFDETEKWLKLLDQNSISWCNWNYSNDWRSGAIFRTFVNSEDSARIVSYSGDWDRMLEDVEVVSFNSVKDYYDKRKMKEAGIWIMEKMRNR